MDIGWLKKLQGFTGWQDKLSLSGANIFNQALEWAEGQILDYLIEEPKKENTTPIRLQIFGNESISCQADITDNFTENNVAYQDHIAIKPMIYTVEGEVGELTWYRNDSTTSVLDAVEQKLEPVVSFSQTLSKTASAVQDKALKIIGVIDSLDNAVSRIWGFLSNDDVNTEQKKVFKYLLYLWLSRSPINIRTPWGNLSGYVIQNLEVSQSDRTVDKSKIKISFKEFKQLKNKKTKFDLQKYMGRGSAQNAELVNKGITTGVLMDEAMCKKGYTQWNPINDWFPQ